MSTPGIPAISVCICTRNRPEELHQALTSVSQSYFIPGQVVVSDDSDDDRAASIVAKATHQIPVVYTRGPRLGLGANRNHVLSLATGEYVLFLDDDAELGRDFLGEMRDYLKRIDAERRTKTIITGAEIQSGRTITPSKQGLLGFQSSPYRLGESLQTVVINAALFPRGLFDHVQFDPQLIYGCDEVDITTQAVALGYEIVPCFTAVNYHHHSPLGRSEYRSFTDASRLYVTLKRRLWTEGSYLRGWSGFGLAIVHVYLASLKRSGTPGLSEARRTVAQAWLYYTNFVRSTRHVCQEGF